MEGPSPSTSTGCSRTETMRRKLTTARTGFQKWRKISKPSSLVEIQNLGGWTSMFRLNQPSCAGLVRGFSNTQNIWHNPLWIVSCYTILCLAVRLNSDGFWGYVLASLGCVTQHGAGYVYCTWYSLMLCNHSLSNSVLVALDVLLEYGSFCLLCSVVVLRRLHIHTSFCMILHTRDCTQMLLFNMSCASCSQDLFSASSFQCFGQVFCYSEDLYGNLQYSLTSPLTVHTTDSWDEFGQRPKGRIKNFTGRVSSGRNRTRKLMIWLWSHWGLLAADVSVTKSA